MGKKLQKYLDEAEKTEQQIAELEERLKTIRAAQKKEEDSEIIRAIRSTKMGGRELLALIVLRCRLCVAQSRNTITMPCL
jgi:hypothetical protein